MNFDTKGITHSLVVGDPELISLYQTNVWFKNGIDSFVQLVLPFFVQGLAEYAKEQKEQNTKDLEQLKWNADPMFFPDPSMGEVHHGP